MVRLPIDKRVVFLLHLLQGLIRKREVGVLYALHLEGRSARLIKMAANCVSEVDEKLMDASVGHVP